MHRVALSGSARRRLSFVFCLAACACARPADRGEVAAPRASLGHAGTEPGAPSIPWSRKTREQRMEFMGLVVHPKMKALFQSANAKAYAHFRCQTCHGDDMEAVGFRMPNALYALPEGDPMKAALDYDATTAKLMEERVVPAMSELLVAGDPGARKVTCHTCHQKE
jgi:hypothetical protein